MTGNLVALCPPQMDHKLPLGLMSTNLLGGYSNHETSNCHLTTNPAIPAQPTQPNQPTRNIPQCPRLSPHADTHSCLGPGNDPLARSFEVPLQRQCDGRLQDTDHWRWVQKQKGASKHGRFRKFWGSSRKERGPCFANLSSGHKGSPWALPTPSLQASTRLSSQAKAKGEWLWAPLFVSPKMT